LQVSLTKAKDRVLSGSLPPGICCVHSAVEKLAFGNCHRLEDKTIHLSARFTSRAARVSF
jgi:hypothetical protein